MEIVYQGGASFWIKDTRNVLLNPAGAGEKGDIVLRSRRVAAKRQIVDGPGEYEIGGVLIVSVAVGPQEGQSLIHAAEIDGINVLFVDAHVSPLNERTVAAVGRVDVLIVRADDVRAAQELAQDVGPRVVIPFGERAVELCAELGVKDATASARFAWNGVAAVPRAVLLKSPAAKRKAA